MEDQVIILMATFNGEAYLVQQLESILAQTHGHWQLYVRDDGSTDASLPLLQQYAQADHRIKVLDIPGPHGSPAFNFGVLFNEIASSAKYLMFADQDDLWQPEKIDRSLYEIKAQEMANDAQMPLLVYSHFQYIDEQGEAIAQTLNLPPRLQMKQLMAGNHAYGCTMLLNAALIAKIGKMPENVPFHDYWVALVACAFGRAVAIPEKLLGYRQHQDNASSNLQQRRWKARWTRYVGTDPVYLQYLRRQYQLIQLFIETYQYQFSAADLKLLHSYFNALRQSHWSFIRFILAHYLSVLHQIPLLLHFFTLARRRAQIIK